MLLLGVGSLVFAKTLYGLLMRPVLRALPPEASALVYTSAIEEINVYMKVGLYGGVFLTTPVILYQLWGFVSPGLYEKERKLASPFIVFGTLAFLAGASFCYFAVLPQMFQFLLREESSVALEGRLNTGKLREEDAMRYLRLGNVARAGALAKEATQEIEASGDGQAKPDEASSASRWCPSRASTCVTRLDGLGKLIDAIARGAGRPGAAAALAGDGEAPGGGRRVQQARLRHRVTLTDEAAKLLEGAQPGARASWRRCGSSSATSAPARPSYESSNWTRPMLSMSEQLTLVLVLLLAFGLIFEMPLVMAVLSLVGHGEVGVAVQVPAPRVRGLSHRRRDHHAHRRRGEPVADGRPRCSPATSSACCWCGSSRSAARTTTHRHRQAARGFRRAAA